MKNLLLFFCCLSFLSCFSIPASAIKINIDSDLQEVIDANESKEGDSIFVIEPENTLEASTGESGEESLAADESSSSDTASPYIEDSARSGGFIQGQVFDKDSGETLRGVVILVEGTDYATLSDSNGGYNIAGIDAGIYTLTYFKDGYIEAKVTETAVVSGVVTTLNFAMPRRPVEMSDDVYELQDFVVTAQEVMSQNVALISLRKQSIGAIEALSSEDFKKYASSDMADAISKISGASTADGKYAVIRGLDDRYNSVLLNNIPIPSPNPDRKAVALDIFPTKLFSNVIVQKSFTANIPGESSGGALMMNTKSFPEEPFFKISSSIGTFKKHNRIGDSYLVDPERSTFKEWLAGNDSRGFNITRESDLIYSDYPNRVGAVNFPLYYPVSKKFNTIPKASGSISFGNQFSISDNFSLGILFANSISSSQKEKLSSTEKVLILEGKFVLDEDAKVSEGLGVLSGADEFAESTLLGLGAKIGDHSKIDYTYLGIERFISEAKIYDYKSYKDQEGSIDPVPAGGPNVFQPGWIQVSDSVLSGLNRELEMNLLSGNHVLTNALDYNFNWNYANIETEQSELDIRNIRNFISEDPVYGFEDLPGVNPLSRFNRITTQSSEVFNASLDKSFKITNDISFKSTLGISKESSERYFNQIEIAEGGDFSQGLMYAAMPSPDGFSQAFGSSFYDSVEESEADVTNLFNNQISSNNNDIVSLEASLNSKNDQLENDYEGQGDGLNDLLLSSQADLADAIAMWNGTGSGGGFSLNIGTNTVHNLDENGLIYDDEKGAYVTMEEFSAKDETVPVPGFFLSYEELYNDPLVNIPAKLGSVAELEEAENQLNQEIARDSANLNTLLAENSVIEQDLQALSDFYEQIANLPNSSDLPISYRGTENFFLETPLGYGVYSSSDALNASYLKSAQFLYEAKGISETNSFFFNNELTFFNGDETSKLSFGARSEDTLLAYENLPPRVSDDADIRQPTPSSGIIRGFEPALIDPRPIDQNDFLYFINFSYEPSDKIKFFISRSRTIAKPTFREVAPFPIFNLLDKSVDLGNPGRIISDINNYNPETGTGSYLLPDRYAGLKISQIYNTDLRLEFYPKEDSLISFGVFKKEINNPIEKVLATNINGIDINSYINNNNRATVSGFEFELKYSLGDASVGCNYANINAEVGRSSFEDIVLDDQLWNGNLDSSFGDRSLYNQPSYLSNFYFSYDIEKLNTNITFSKSFVGEQLYRTGFISSGSGQGSPDLYLDPYWNSNLVIRSKINDVFSVSFAAKNIFASNRSLSYAEEFESAVIDSNVYEDDSHANPIGTLSDYKRSSYKVLPSYSLSISAEF
ncbi:MAG: hypothetical protein CML12_00165 [Puniceicoccaceae bacterium]|nr:hypothetical protein [Puniceicoccaceae bacterium]RCL31549.1 MAG: TonB-dependent receptor [Puniceicoccaceae bacterium]